IVIISIELSHSVSHSMHSAKLISYIFPILSLHDPPPTDTYTLSLHDALPIYTPEMEKAMHQSHKMGFAEYSRNLDNRLTVEKRRQQEYEKCKHIVAEIDSQIHR